METKVTKSRKQRGHRSKSQVKRYRVQDGSPFSVQANSPYVRVTNNPKQPQIPGQTTLIGQSWLNCDVVNHFVKLVCQSTAISVRVESNLFTVLTNEGYKNRVVNWMKRTRTSDVLHYFFPICHENHWSLLYVDTANQTCTHFTSRGKGEVKFCRTFLRFLDQCALSHHEQERFCTFQVRTSEECSQGKENTFDCGVFVCLFVYKISRGLRPQDPFTPDEIWRKRILTCFRENSVRIFDKVYGI